MPAGHLGALQGNPEVLEGFLGREPEIEGADALVFELFWRVRRATPSDQPIDPLRALDLYERLYGDCNELVVLDQLAVMDGAYAKHVAGEIAAKTEKAKAR